MQFTALDCPSGVVPDFVYTNLPTDLMADRAQLSKREAYLTSNGTQFFGSKDFPDTLISSVLKRDPKALLFGRGEVKHRPSEIEQRYLRRILDSCVRGKSLLICSGGDDKLVPYRCSEPFLRFVKEATQSWYSDGDLHVEDIVYPGVGHEYTVEMINATSRFVTDAMSGAAGNLGQKMSKI